MKTPTTALAIAATALFFVSGGVASAQDAIEEAAAENFMQADVNADGALDFDEFVQFINLNADDNLGRAGLIRRFGRYEMAFSRADMNADGVVTPDELAARRQQ